MRSELPTLSREIDARMDESARTAAAAPSLETLRTLRAGWERVADTLAGWQESLARRATATEADLAALTADAEVWQATAAAAQTPGGSAPAEVRRRIESVRDAVRATRSRAEARRAELLELQTSVAEQAARVTEAREALGRAQGEAVNQLLVRSSPPIWDRAAFAESVGGGGTLAQQGQETLSAQATALDAYAARRAATFLLHLAIVGALVLLMYRARERVRALVEEDPGLSRASQVFATPVATALLLGLLASGWLYPQAPRLFWAVVGAAALVPTVIVLRRLIEPRLAPILYALIVFYLLDQVRSVTASIPLASRLLFLGQMLGGIGFLLWLLGAVRRTKLRAERARFWKVVAVGAKAALAAFVFALAASALGFVPLAAVVAEAVLGSAYFAVILLALLRILDGLTLIVLRLPFAARFAFVRRHRSAIRRGIRNVLRLGAAALWVLSALELAAVRAPLLERVRAFLAFELSVGTLTVTPGNVIAFAVTVWAAFFASRVVRFLLEEDVYPRFDLARGLPYAISTMLHYVILLLGFFVSMAALGIDMTKFTILAGAFGVGLGFGMQNIVNNFVSGLILLFERPIKIGDVIQIEDTSGVVEHIGIRASVVRTASGSELIVPNGKFISDRVTNWTFTNNRRVITVPVGVAAESADPERVLALLADVAATLPDVVDDPAPRAVLTAFDGKTLKFDLHATTTRVEDWEQVRSDLALALRAALAREEIALA